MQDSQDVVLDSQFAMDGPFAMLINPKAVLQAIEQSSRLGALNSRVCRPLDKPLIPKRDADEQHAFDESVEHTAIADTEIGTIY